MSRGSRSGSPAAGRGPPRGPPRPGVAARGRHAPGSSGRVPRVASARRSARACPGVGVRPELVLQTAAAGCRRAASTRGVRRPGSPTGAMPQPTSSRASRPRERSSGCARRIARGGVVPRGAGAGRAAASVQRAHRAGEASASHRCTSRAGASAVSTCQLVGGQSARAEHRQALGQVHQTRVGDHRCAGRARRSAGLGAPISARRRRQSSGCQARSAARGSPGAVWSPPSASGPPPSPAAGRALAGIRARTARPGGHATANRRSRRCRSGPPGPSGSGPSQSARGAGPGLRTRARRAGGRSPPAAARPLGGRARDRSPVVTPVAWAITSLTMHVGDGKSHIRAHPVGPPGAAPNCMARPWLMNRSIPGVGTATRSGVNGSAGAVASTSARPATQHVGALAAMDVHARTATPASGSASTVPLRRRPPRRRRPCGSPRARHRPRAGRRPVTGPRRGCRGRWPGPGSRRRPARRPGAPGP